jgi:hypothetical protein
MMYNIFSLRRTAIPGTGSGRMDKDEEKGR